MSENRGFEHIYAVSDLHTDYDLNLGRIDNSHGWLIYAKYVDELIVAGSTEAIVDWLRDKVVPTGGAS